MAQIESADRGLTSLWSEFFDLYVRDKILELAAKPGDLKISFSELERYHIELADELIKNPDKTLKTAETVLSKTDLPVDIQTSDLGIRIISLPEEHTFFIRELRSTNISQFLQLEGIIRKATEVRPKIVKAVFECQRCGERQTVKQNKSEFIEPYACRGCERKGPFELLREKSEFLDSQKLQLQEPPEELAGGEQPQNIDIHVTGNLAGKVTPGNRVKITGIPRSYQKKRRGSKKTVFDLFIEGNSIEIEDQEFEEIEISKEEKQKIEEFSNEPAIYGKIIDSISPTIYGYEDVKEAVALQLFGGVSKEMPDGTYIRGDIHVLLIGDPGMGKSQILRYVKTLTPRGVYASGKSSSAAGLTAAAVKDEFGEGNWSLEAGALVLADKGVAAIDEVDKMREDDRSALHEAMEQQCFGPKTKVQLANKEVKPIKEIVDSNLQKYGSKRTKSGKKITKIPKGEIEVISFSKEKISTIKKPVTVVGKRKAPKKMLRIKLENGEEIEVTPEHPCYKLEKDKLKKVEARKLTSGDFLPTPLTKKTSEEKIRGIEQLNSVKKEKKFKKPFKDSDFNKKFNSVLNRLKSCQKKFKDISLHKSWPVYDGEVKNPGFIQARIQPPNQEGRETTKEKLGPKYLDTRKSYKVLEKPFLGKKFLVKECKEDKDLIESLNWFKIEEIEAFKPSYDFVYDLTVPGTKNFVSHDIIVHNSVSIAKAGINTTLKTRCALLGAANPKYGRFDVNEPISQQIDMEPALLSRFDLIFPLKDLPSEEKDSKIAEHIINSHSDGEKMRRGEEDLDSKEVEPPIKPDLMRKYVSIAKDIVPVMKEEAKEKIKDFYVDLRTEGSGDSPVPVTARQLEALVRLAEGSARMRLSDEVKSEDARRAIRIVKSCLAEVGVDPETGQYDIDVITTGVSKSQRDKIKTIKDLIRELEKEYSGKAPRNELLNRAEELGLSRSDIKDKLEKLREGGEIYFPDSDHLKVA